MNPIVTKNCIHIDDSYTASKKEIIKILNELKENNPDCEVFNRSMKSLVREWIAHNRLYKLGLGKSHTKDVDLEYPIKWYGNLIGNIIGICRVQSINK